MQSNITLPSNVYINKTGKLFDSGLIKHIWDYNVLAKLRRIYGENALYPLLTQAQLDLLKNGIPKCSLEYGSMSWGIPVNGTMLRCRCEQKSCRYFKQCASLYNFDLIERRETRVVNKPKATVDYTPLPVLTDTLPLSITPRLAKSVELEVTPPIAEQLVIDFEQTSEELIAPQGKQESSTDVVILDSPDEIIHAPMSERIWVNAGPGTGKTYTVIHRLKALLDTENDDGIILVLCFSRNAVQVINERLREALGEEHVARLTHDRLIIRTFDSFASYMLDDELDTSAGYDKRIVQFTKALKANPEPIGAFSYIIVDELQDVVDVRAKMVKDILSHLNGGALLLGDYCQAIYDWSARDNGGVTSDFLRDWLQEQTMFKRYELIKNHRQPKRLSALSELLRDALQSADEETQEAVYEHCKDEIRRVGGTVSVKTLHQTLCGRNELVLCKTNGQVAAISQLLLSNNVRHTVAHNARYASLAAWIALTLSSCTDGLIDKQTFLTKANENLVDEPEYKWSMLKAIDKHSHSQILHVKDVMAAIRAEKALPDMFFNRSGDGILVSTVHRAKGSEAEHVYWLDSPLTYEAWEGVVGAKSDALKAAYVAITRGKGDIHMVKEIKDFYMRCLDDGRWIRIGKASSGNTYCKGIVFQPEDVDMASFAQDDELSDAKTKQGIIHSLDVGDPIELFIRNDSSGYDVFCDGVCIGHMADSLKRALRAGFNATNHSRNFPGSISAYVSRVVSVVGVYSDKTAQEYRQSGCWLGLELGGIGQLNW